MIDPDYPEEIRLFLHNGGKKDYVWSAGNPLGQNLVLPCPVNKVNGKLQQPDPCRMPKCTDVSGMKIQVILPTKEPRPAEMLAKGGGKMGRYKYQLRPCDQLKKLR